MTKKPCPFCGSIAYTECNEYRPGSLLGENYTTGSLLGSDCVIRCSNIGCPVRPHVRRVLETHAIEAWNTRYNPF